MVVCNQYGRTSGTASMKKVENLNEGQVLKM